MIKEKNRPARKHRGSFRRVSGGRSFPISKHKGENTMEVLLIIACVLVALICLAIVGYILFRPAVPKQEIPAVQIRPEEEDASDADADGDENADDASDEGSDDEITGDAKAADVSAEDENAPDDGDAEEVAAAADGEAETAEEEVTALENDGAVSEDTPEDDTKNIEE